MPTKRTTRKRVKTPRNADELLKFVREQFPEDWHAYLVAHWHVDTTPGIGYQSERWSLNVSHKTYGIFDCDGNTLGRLWVKLLNEVIPRIQAEITKRNAQPRLMGPKIEGPQPRQLRLA